MSLKRFLRKVWPSKKPDLVFSLDRPYPLQVLKGESYFSGFLFSPDKHVKELIIEKNGHQLRLPLNIKRKELVAALPSFKEVHQSGFSISLPIRSAKRLRFLAKIGNKKYEAGSYDLSKLRKEHDLWRQISRLLAPFSPPPPNLIELTQGIKDPLAYQESIATGAYLFLKILKSKIVETPSTILDFGCGTGRLGLAWWILGKMGFLKRTYKIYGVDINQVLLSWARHHLPVELEFIQGNLIPPLPWPDKSFDLIYCVSVFTHLKLETQELWLEEFARLLHPDGFLLLTLHGPIYASVFFHDQVKNKERFFAKGYLESHGPEGLNTFGAFHHPNFVRQFFTKKGFKLSAIFLKGDLGQPFPFRLAFLQDVYIFRRSIKS